MATYTFAIDGDDMTTTEGTVSPVPHRVLALDPQDTVTLNGDVDLMHDHLPFVIDGHEIDTLNGDVGIAYFLFYAFAIAGEITETLNGEITFTHFQGGIHPPALGTRMAALVNHTTEQGE